MCIFFLFGVLVKSSFLLCWMNFFIWLIFDYIDFVFTISWEAFLLRNMWQYLFMYLLTGKCQGRWISPPPFFTGSCPFQGSTASNKKCFEFFSIIIFQKYSLEKLYFLRNILDPLYLVRMPVHHMRYFRIHNRNHSKISGMTVFLYLDGLLFKHKLSILQQSCKDMCIGFGLLIKIEHPYFVLRKHTVLHNRVL